MVTHIDDTTIAALTEFYRTFLPEGGDVLDLMSSWISHLPEEREYGRVAGLGMNAEELAANPRLDDWCVHNLNNSPIRFRSKDLQPWQRLIINNNHKAVSLRIMPHFRKL